jgi:exodeoxyribonuclease V alpha subunit
MPLRSEEGDTSCDFYFISAETHEEIGEKLFHVVTERIPKRFSFDPLRDIQVLAPMNHGGLGARSLNIELQKRLNANAEPKLERFGWSFAPGDKVIQTVNNYDKNVFNGDIGTVARVDLEEGALCVNYEGREVAYEFGELDEVSLAYAVSIHKSQGSEYPAVVIPLATPALHAARAKPGVTRGRKLVVIVGQPKALALAVRTVRSVRRLTHLAGRLSDRKERAGDRLQTCRSPLPAQYSSA